LGSIRFRSLSSAVPKGRPPPPPPPPPRKPKVPAAKGHVARSGSATSNQPGTGPVVAGRAKKGGGVAPFLVLGVFGAAVFGVKQYDSWRKQKAAEEDAKPWYEVEVKQEPHESDGQARKYLEEMASKGDEMAANVLKSSIEAENELKALPRFDPNSTEPVFRLNIGREGLKETLRMQLEMRRMEERMILKKFRQSLRTVLDQKTREELAVLESEKADIKRLLRNLER